MERIVNGAGDKHRLQYIWTLAAWLALCTSAWAAEPEAIQADINFLLDGLGRKVNLQERIDRVAKHGTNAVPILIKNYTHNEPDKRWPLAACLCQVPSVESLDFLKAILRSHDDQQVASQVIQRFPLEQEDQITLLLVDLLAVPRLAFDADDRLRMMIFRKPGRAGDLVRAMDLSDKSMTGRNWNIGEVLAYVSGYSHTWCCFGPTSTDWGAWQHDFWAAWWKRNNDKDPFDWLVETFRSDTGNDSRQAEALQVLGSLKDSRSKTLLIGALDSKSERVRYWAVVGLQRLDGTLDPSGYRWELFQEEQVQVIKRLKKRFSDQVNKLDNAQDGAANGSQPIRSETNRTSSAAGSRR